jgi:4-hydroxybenzoate polyprenyltransferase
MSSLRTLLILGRISNLPTVWSNCLAAWWLGGGGNNERLPWLFAGTSLLYIGGMFLNDAFDAGFDREHRKERPIPSGQISRGAVSALGSLGLVLGLVCLFHIGTETGTLGGLCALAIVVYDAVHKRTVLSPLIMGLCRFFVYLIAASAGIGGPAGWAAWGGVALWAYIIGLSYVAKRESLSGPAQYWPLLCLAAPIVLALVMNAGGYLQAALVLCAVLALWIVRSLRFVFRTADLNLGRAVASLLAGIVLVDLLAVPDMPRPLALAFPALFVLALLLQRIVPAT